MMRMMVVALPGQKIDFDTGLWTKVALLFGDVVFILLPMISANSWRPLARRCLTKVYACTRQWAQSMCVTWMCVCGTVSVA
jgi:hypothetical protein